MNMPERAANLPGPISFVCNQTFTAAVNGYTNRYRAGQAANGSPYKYTIHPGAKWQDLYEKALQWAQEGKIRFVQPDGTGIQAKLSMGG